MKIPVFVVMPFGKKSDKRHRYTIDFDAIYHSAILPALNSEDAIVTIREDSELFGGIIHRTMYEKLVCTDIVLADLSNENPNVFYELGIRHAARPYSNILICNKSIEKKIPFDLSPLRIIFYKLSNGKLPAEERHFLCEQIKKRIQMIINNSPSIDSPIFELIPEFPHINKKKAQLFREHFAICSAFYQKVGNSETLEELKNLENDIENLPVTREDLVHILRLFVEKLRSFESFDDMVYLIEKYRGKAGVHNEFLDQQYALALNRIGKAEKAVKEIQNVISIYGESPESYGILGRIYKDRYIKTSKIGYLEKAIESYQQGFNLDIRDFYPGINLATLLLQKGDGSSLKKMRDVVTILRYTLALNNSSTDIWHQCSLIELLCLQQDWAEALNQIEILLARIPAPTSFVLNTLRNNLSLIEKSFNKQHISTQDLQKIIKQL